MKKISRASVTLQNLSLSYLTTKNSQGDFRRLYNQRKQRELFKKYSIIIGVSIQMIFLIIFFLQSGFFPLGVAVALFLLLLNICFIALYLIYDDQGLSKDPGIVVWWLCCIRVGKSEQRVNKANNNNIPVVEEAKNYSVRNLKNFSLRNVRLQSVPAVIQNP